MFDTQIIWLQPLWFIAIPLVLALAWLGRRHVELPAHQQIILLHPAWTDNPRSSPALGRATSKAWLFQAVAFSLIVASLARPQTVGDWIPEPPEGRDFILLLDTSQSMGVRDFDYNGQSVARIDVLKGVVNRFVDARVHDRFALITFASSAATVVPMTADGELVKQMLRRLRLGLLGDDTAVGEALVLGVKQLTRAIKYPPVLLLFSDGENNAGDISPRDALILAQEYNAKIYTVAVTQTVDIPAQGGDPEPGLSDIARLTGGRYYTAGATNLLENVLRDVDRLEQTHIPPAKRKQIHEWYWLPLAAAILILILERGMRLRDRSGA